MTLLLMPFLLLPLSGESWGARAQGTDALALLQDHKVSNETIYVNAGHAPVVPEALAGTMHRLGYAGRLTLTLTALRMVDEGRLSLDRPLAKDLPDLLEDTPFTVALTLRHILSDTSGFAVPPAPYRHAGGKSAPLENFLIPARTPGQAASDDPVAWALLVRLMESVGGQSVDVLVREDLLAPLGIDPAALTVPEADGTLGGTSYFGPVYGQMARSDALAALAQVLVTNTDRAGAPFLKTATWRALTDTPSFRLHPLAPEHMLGLVRLYAGHQAWLALGGTCVAAPYIMAFPAAHSAFVHLPDATGCPHAAFQQAVLGIAEATFPPVDSTAREAAAQKIKAAKSVGGRYAGADHLSAWTRERIGTLLSDDVTLYGAEAGVVLMRRGVKPEAFRAISPYYYQSDAGAPLILSPYRLGGYMLTAGRLYRHVGKLADPRYLFTPLPWLLLITASSVFYVLSRTDRAWRYMALLGFSGSLLIALGIYGEWVLWPSCVYGADKVWLVTLWRTGLNIGLMFVVALPLYAASFRRRKLLPERGLGALFAAPHLVIISLAALALLFILTAWGLAGTFTGP